MLKPCPSHRRRGACEVAHSTGRAPQVRCASVRRRLGHEVDSGRCAEVPQRRPIVSRPTVLLRVPTPAYLAYAAQHCGPMLNDAVDCPQASAVAAWRRDGSPWLFPCPSDRTRRPRVHVVVVECTVRRARGHGCWSRRRWPGADSTGGCTLREAVWSERRRTMSPRCCARSSRAVPCFECE